MYICFANNILKIGLMILYRMIIEDLIGKCAAYDFKLMLEEKRPKSWLKSVRAFANELGDSLFFDIADVSSERRNPILANVMAQLDYMEKRGSGLTRICNETKALEGYKDELKPKFSSSPAQFQTIIYASVDSVNVGDFVGDVSETKLTERQRKIVELVRESPSMTAKQMSETLSVSRRTVERDLAVMREMGVIKREGKDNNGIWRVGFEGEK